FFYFSFSEIYKKRGRKESYEMVRSSISNIHEKTARRSADYEFSITLTDNRENNNSFYFQISDNGGEEDSNRVLFATNNRSNKIYRAFARSVLKKSYIENFKQRVGSENVKESLSITRNGKPVKDLTAYKIILWIILSMSFIVLLLLNLFIFKKFFRNKNLDDDKEFQGQDNEEGKL
ncbi:MAG: hypothetical protein JXR63_07150, partial [Spirochaetales bacterium]|nr:hypothetical protein [Spirochaetales bacterium]